MSLSFVEERWNEKILHHFPRIGKKKKLQFMYSSRETRGNFFFETEKEKGREILDRLLRVLFEGRCNWIVSLVWGGVKRWIFLEGERREDCRIISDRNQKCFISSTLISTKVIPLSEKLHLRPCNSEQNLSFFDLSPLLASSNLSRTCSRMKLSSIFFHRWRNLDELKFDEFFLIRKEIERGKYSYCIIFITSFFSPSMLSQYFKSANQYAEM